MKTEIRTMPGEKQEAVTFEKIPFVKQMRPQHRSISHAETVNGNPSEANAHRDRRILEKAEHALNHSGYEQLRHVRTYCDHGRITLQGRVATYYLKQLAQEVVRSVSDVRDIDNDLHVVCRQ